MLLAILLTIIGVTIDAGTFYWVLLAFYCFYHMIADLIDISYGGTDNEKT